MKTKRTKRRLQESPEVHSSDKSILPYPSTWIYKNHEIVTIFSKREQVIETCKRIIKALEDPDVIVDRLEWSSPNYFDKEGKFGKKEQWYTSGANISIHLKFLLFDK
jgi:hypothetical protein